VGREWGKNVMRLVQSGKEALSFGEGKRGGKDLAREKVGVLGSPLYSFQESSEAREAGGVAPETYRRYAAGQDGWPMDVCGAGSSLSCLSCALEGYETPDSLQHLLMSFLL
jgi:hypothetical protein